jgi:hypothetical protein
MTHMYPPPQGSDFGDGSVLCAVQLITDIRCTYHGLFIDGLFAPARSHARPPPSELRVVPDPIAAWCLHLLPRGAGVQVAGVKGNRVQELMRQNQYVFNAVVELAGQFVVGNRPCQDSQAIHTYAYIHTYIHTYVHAYIHTYIHTYMHTYIHTYIHASSRPCQDSQVSFLYSQKCSIL